jgi:hypothetical protein
MNLNRILPGIYFCILCKRLEVESLVNEEKPAGNCEVNFDASALSGRICLYRLPAGKFFEIRKMTLLK